MIISDLIGPLIEGLIVTVELLAIAFIVGNVAALMIALARTSSKALPKKFFDGFADFVRGTPLLVQMYLIYYSGGAVLLGIDGIRDSIFWPLVRDGFWYAAFALVINTAAYSSEVIKGAIQKVDAGEIEAAQALGLSKYQVARFVIVPLALRLCLPVLGGEAIMILKATSVASLVTVMDLMGQANLIRMTTLEIYPPLLAAGLIYVVLAGALSVVFRGVEKKWSI